MESLFRSAWPFCHRLKVLRSGGRNSILSAKDSDLGLGLGLLMSTLTLVLAATPALAEVSLELEKVGSWRSIPENNEFLSTCGGQGHLIQFALPDGTKVVCVAVDLETLSVIPALSEGGTQPTSVIAARHQALAGINGGYFNLSNGESASFVTAITGAVADPRVNKALVENPKLKVFLPQIFARSELRFLRRGKKPEAQIAGHNEKLPPGARLVAALQAGPRLLPELTASAEAFLREEPGTGKQVDSIGVNRPAARSAVGLTADRYLLMVAVAGKGQDEFSSGLTLPQMAILLKNLGAVAALNLDGGTSTTLVCALGGHDIANDLAKAEPNLKMLIGRNPETRVRSALLVVRKEQKEKMAH